MEVPLMASSDDDEEKAGPSTRKKRKTIVWKWIQDFDDGVDANNFLSEQKCWSKSNTNNCNDGRKVVYRCNRGKKRTDECGANVQLLFDATSDIVKYYESESVHTCDANKEKGYGISEAVKTKIIKYQSYKMKPKAILRQLSKKFDKIPTIVQLNNFLAAYKKGNAKDRVFELGDLKALLDVIMEIPENDVQAFVVSYEIHEEDGPDGHAIFRFFISSKKLLRMTVDHARHVHADTTYKLIWEGFPVLLVGTTDQERHFHLSGITVASNEKTEDFRFLFASLKKGIFNVTGEEFEIKTLVADGAGAIHNGFKLTFGDDSTILMCWVHMQKKLEEKVKSLIPKCDQEDIIIDVKLIQLITCTQTFDAVLTLFFEKWNKHNEFLTYFRSEWIDQNALWYEGAKERTPSHNNALEGTNRVIKDEGTFRNRLPLPRFVEVVQQLVHDWGARYEDNSIMFNDSTSIDLPLWTKAYQWAKLNKTLLCTDEGDNKIFRVPGGNTLTVPQQEPSYTEWRTFDHFKRHYFSEWKVVMPLSDQWKTGKCSCPYFAKFYICKHMLGIALRYKLEEPPLAAKQIAIGQKRKRGRPAKAKSALYKQ